MTPAQEIEIIVAKLRKYGNLVAGERKRIASLGGAYMASSLEAAAPRGKKVHKRYSTAKVAKRMRAPKGMGRVVATYYPGNLGMSLQVLPFNRANTKVFVGAKLARRATGSFGQGKRTDGYYLNMVENGTAKSGSRPFYRATVDRSKDRVYKLMEREWRRISQKFENENKIV
jgi:thiamine biosynthesis protein ThiC